MKKRETSLPLFDEPPQANAKAEVICADVLRWAETYTGPKFHAMVCDPPYHLTNVVMDFPTDGSSIDQRSGRQRSNQRQQRGGFMNQRWDGTGADGQGIAFKPETWKALAQHLLPGAFIMAFGSSRGWHRLACAMEDAGLRIYPSIFGWLGAQAFPKATRIDTQVDRYNGLEKLHQLSAEIARARAASGFSLQGIGQQMQEATSGQYGQWYHRGGHMFFETGKSLPSRPEWEHLRHVLPIRPEFQDVYEAAEREVIGANPSYRKLQDTPSAYNLVRNPDVTAPATPLAQIWAGHRYGGQMLKNSLEPIIVAQVPYAGKPVQSIVEHGSGALWIDGARLSLASHDQKGEFGPRSVGLGEKNAHGTYDGRFRRVDADNRTGRWPPNFVLQHDPRCVAHGTRQLKNGSGSVSGREPSQPTIDVYGEYRRKPFAKHADANGLETVQAWACHESCVVRKLDAQAGYLHGPGYTKPAGGHLRQENRSIFTNSKGGIGQDEFGGARYGDSGSASRFFMTADWSLDVGEQASLASGSRSEPPTWNCVPECPVRKLDLQAGVRKGPWGHGQSEATAPTPFATNPRAIDNGRWHGDTSNASRFFHVSSWSLDVAEHLAQADPAYYCAKSASSEREAGLIGHLPCLSADDPQVVHEGDPVTTRQHYRLDAQGQPIRQKNGAIAYVVCHRNGHPTQKPLTLTQWLATLLLPPADYGPRRLLNVFSGSGAEGIGALLAGWDEIVMVDSDQSYVDISRQRLAYWSQHKDTQR